MLDVDAACLDEAVEAPNDWLREASTSECNDFFESMFAANEDTKGGTRHTTNSQLTHELLTLVPHGPCH